MTYEDAIAAAEVLREAGQFDAADHMLCQAEMIRKQNAHWLAGRCHDDPDFDLAHGDFVMERGADRPEVQQ